jgi:hypothetical protein
MPLPDWLARLMRRIDIVKRKLADVGKWTIARRGDLDATVGDLAFALNADLCSADTHRPDGPKYADGDDDTGRR